MIRDLDRLKSWPRLSSQPGPHLGKGQQRADSPRGHVYSEPQDGIFCQLNEVQQILAIDLNQLAATVSCSDDGLAIVKSFAEASMTMSTLGEGTSSLGILDEVDV